MKIVILAGGGGSRLFPLSRTCFPKQFLRLEEGKSLIAQTVLRFLKFVAAKDILIVTNDQYFYHIQNELAECGAEDVQVIFEPVGRNTAPAIALAVKYCKDVLGCTENEVLLIAPADHVIKANDVFIKNMQTAIMLAENNKLVTLGIVPDRPETGYGYIEAGAAVETAYEVRAFTEKPSLDLVQQYLAAGNYYWNAGIFVFNIGFILAELSRYQPEILQCMEGDYQKVIDGFSSMPDISFDYAVAEKSKDAVVVPLECYWNDIGSWDALYDVLEKDAFGNAMKGDCLTIDCSNSLIIGRDRLIAGIGLDDLLLVETDDVIVVAKKGESQKVKDVVEELKRRGRKEADQHTVLYRSWGSSALLGEGPHYRMKKIFVKPGGRLSLQMHYHRSEHWIVIAGTAQVTMGDKVMMVHENESVFIPQTMKHRLENPGKIPLEIIEVQNGNYVGEDDIVRFDEK